MLLSLWDIWVDNSLFSSVPHFLIELFGFLKSNFLSSLYILDISPLLHVGLVNIFSQTVGCHFVLLTVSLALEKLCNFMRSHLSILDLRACKPLVFCSGTFPLHPRIGDCFPHFSSVSFSVSGFIWRTLFYLDLSFVQGYKNRLNSSTCWPPVEPAPFVEMVRAFFLIVIMFLKIPASISAQIAIWNYLVLVFSKNCRLCISFYIICCFSSHYNPEWAKVITI